MSRAPVLGGLGEDRARDRLRARRGLLLSCGKRLRRLVRSFAARLRWRYAAIGRRRSIVEQPRAPGFRKEPLRYFLEPLLSQVAPLFRRGNQLSIWRHVHG